MAVRTSLILAASLAVTLLALAAPRLASAQSTSGTPIQPTAQTLGTVVPLAQQPPCEDPPCDPPPENSPPFVTIVTPGTVTGTRTPVFRVTYEPGGTAPGDEVNPGSVSVTWGGVNVTALGRYNQRLFEWEVTPQYQIVTRGVWRTFSVTTCSQAGLCTTQTGKTKLSPGDAAILSVTPMPLEALGRQSALAFGPGFGLSGVDVVSGVSTPAYYSWDTPRSAGLTYSSRQSYPRALVNVDLEFPGSMPSALTMKLWDAGVVVQQFTQTSPSCSSGGQPRCRVALQADFLSTSSYPAVHKWLKVEAVATIGGTPYSTVDSVEVVLVDRRTTPYGSGWWPSAVLRLVTAGSDAIIVGSDGSATIYRGHQESYVSHPGDYSTLVKTGLGWELGFREGGKLIFDAQGRQTAVQGANALWQTTISYNTTDQVNRITDPVGKYFQFNYSGGVLSTISDPGGRQSTVNISGGQLLSSTPPTPAGHNYTQSFAWHGFSGSAVLPNYQQNAQAHRTTIQYDGSWRPYRVTLPWVQDENGASIQPQLTYYPQELKGLGATASLDTVQATLLNPRGDWSAWTLNRWGQTLRAWDARGTLGLRTYSPEGLVLTSEGKTGDSTRVYRTYDNLGHLVRTYRLRSGGSLLLDSLVWNAEHRMIRQVDVFGNWTSYAYNGWGSVTSAISSVGDTTVNFYNVYSGRLDSTHTGGVAGYTRYFHAGTWGNTDSVRTPDGTVRSRNTYDGFGRLSSAESKIVVQATSATTQLQWRRRLVFLNTANQTDSVRVERTNNCTAPCNVPSWPNPTDWERTRTTRRVYSYVGSDSVLVGPTGWAEETRVHDALGRLVSRTVAASPAETFRYDAAGNLRFHVTRRGYQLEAQYDSLGRVSRRLVPAVGTFTYTYGGPNDELTAITADAGYADPVGGSNPNLAWTYNQSGQLVSETTQGNRTTTYVYDSYYRTSSYTDAVGPWQVAFHAQRGTPDTLITPHGDRVGYALDGRGRLNGPWVDGSGTDFSRTQVWRDQGGLRELVNSQGYEVGHLTVADDEPDAAYDSLSPRWDEQHGLGGPTHTYVDSLSLDGWERVTQVNHVADNQSVSLQYLRYDPSGNMSIGSDPYVWWTFSLIGNRLLGTGSCAYGYDEAGNVTTRTCGSAVTIYTYDALERLTGVSLPGGVSVAYSYDASGQRIAKKVGGVATRFVWRGGHVVYETSGGGTLTRSYTWGTSTDDLVAIHDHEGGGHYYIVQDRLRSVRGLVDRGGAWQVAWRYGIYGQVLSAEGSAPFAVRFRWAGAQYDEETGFYYLRSRFYDPALGRFIQEDPIGHEGGLNLYAYADGNPTVARDPSGMGAEPEPEDPSPYACLGTIRGCGDTSSDTFFWGGGGGGGGGSWFDELDAWSAENDAWLERTRMMQELVKECGGGCSLERYNEITTRYAHLDRMTVSTGDPVNEGQIIGYVGWSGCGKCGVHLHFEMRVNGVPIEPINGSAYFGWGSPLRNSMEVPYGGDFGTLRPYDRGRGWRHHEGVDLAVRGELGVPVYAVARGRVEYAGNGLRGYGNLVIIRHWPI
jgi:RHS repeat-associated protein